MAFNEIGLRNKILMAVGVPVFLLMLVTYINFSSLQDVEETDAWIDHTHAVLTDAQEVFSLSVDMETGMRGYLLAGKKEFLAPYIKGKKESAKLMHALKQTVSDNPEQVKRLETLENIMATWDKEVAQVNINLRQKISESKSLLDLADFVAEARGKALFDKFRQDLKTFIQRELALLEKRQKEFTNITNIGEVRASVDWVAHTYQAISQAQNILSSGIDMETGMRGYLLAGREAFLTPYKEGNENFYVQVSKLQQFVADNPSQVELISQAASTIKEWQGNVASNLINIRRDIGDSKNMEHLARLVGEAKGKTYFDQFRGTLKEFLDVENGLLQLRKSENIRTLNRMNELMIISVLVAFIVSVGAAIMISNNVLKQVGGEPNRIALLAGRVANGDLLIKFSKTKKLSGINQAMSDMVDSIKGITKQIMSATTNVASSLSEISASIATQTSGAAQQASAINETTTTLEEIKSTSTQTLDKAEVLGNIAMQAREKGQQGIKSTNQTIDAMRAIRKKVEAIAETNLALSEQTKQIGEITGVVNNLSQQSKMLALNASIEAAKAGEAGKGFAVVAIQIGNLAERSEESTGQVQKILESIRNATDRAVMATEEGTKEVDLGVNLVGQTGEAMDSLNTVIRDTSVASDQIVAAVRQEVAGIKQIATAMSEIEKITLQFVSSAEQNEKAIQGLETVVCDLDTSVKFYKLD